MSRTVAILSDIHANSAAFQAALHDVKQHSVDGVWCLGDIVGRGPDPIGALMDAYRLYKDQSPEDRMIWLSGNHDRMAVGDLDTSLLMDPATNEIVGTLSGMSITATTMAAEHGKLIAYREKQRDWLAGLPSHAQMGHLYAAHGIYLLTQSGVSQSDCHSTYGELAEQKRSLFSLVNADPSPRLLLNGHTHQVGVWQWSAAKDDLESVYDPAVERYQLYHLDREPVCLNPGSVGFPRDQHALPTYMLLTYPEDFSSIEVTIRPIYYDWEANPIPDDYPPAYLEEMKHGSHRLL